MADHPLQFPGLAQWARLAGVSQVPRGSRLEPAFPLAGQQREALRRDSDVVASLCYPEYGVVCCIDPIKETIRIRT